MEGLDEVVRQWQYIRIDKKWARTNKSYTYSASDLNPMFCARNILDSYRRNRINCIGMDLFKFKDINLPFLLFSVHVEIE